MDTSKPSGILRIYIGSTDRFKFAPLYEVIVFAARRNGLAGASVLKGVMGYGSSSRVYSLKFWEIQEKVPLVIEIVDNLDKLNKFITVITPYFDKVNKGALITLEPAKVVLYQKGKRG